MIHTESNQLFIGPYVIDANGKVRVIPSSKMPGRLTGMARSLNDPANKILYATMEQGFYEVDVHTLDVKTLFKDGNLMKKEGAKSYESDMLLGVHGKGFYSGQGVYVYSNNGEAGDKALVDPKIEAGSLSEWDGKEWKLIRRNQFTEVTGPGGISGNKNPQTDAIWATGWDYKSVILASRDHQKWSFYRLPKASNSYDGAHGWNTEWPRIRNIGSEKQKDYLMTMHGMFWKFPVSFQSTNTAGIRPKSSYLKVIGDFANWNNELVFGCDDAAKSEFLNKRKEKGGILGPGQSNSNLWFTHLQEPNTLGTTAASGSVWYQEKVSAGAVSEPFLFAGWTKRTGLFKNHSSQNLILTLEIDLLGNGVWQKFQQITIGANKSVIVPFAKATKGEWIRVKSNQSAIISASFVYGDDKFEIENPSNLFSGISSVKDSNSVGGIMVALGDNSRKLGILANATKGKTCIETGYYEMDSSMQLVAVNNPIQQKNLREKVSIPSQVVQIEASSYLIIDGKGRRWRLPKTNDQYDILMQRQAMRICREVATERDLFNCGGTFYELPSENADGFAKIKPIATHGLNVNDYTSFRGMLVVTGINPNKTQPSTHLFYAADKKAVVWAGVIDDLWKLGKPKGRGGPWLATNVETDIPSDPYLFGGYDQKKLHLSHQSTSAITIRVELDASGDGVWYEYKSITIPSGKSIDFVFPEKIQAKWIRLIASQSATITASFDYN